MRGMLAPAQAAGSPHRELSAPSRAPGMSPRTGGLPRPAPGFRVTPAVNGAAGLGISPQESGVDPVPGPSVPRRSGMLIQSEIPGIPSRRRGLLISS